MDQRDAERIITTPHGKPQLESSRAGAQDPRFLQVIARVGQVGAELDRLRKLLSELANDPALAPELWPVARYSEGAAAVAAMVLRDADPRRDGEWAELVHKRFARGEGPQTWSERGDDHCPFGLHED